MKSNQIEKSKMYKLCPFTDKDGHVSINRRPLRDICYIWQIPAPSHYGENSIIHMPVNVQEDYREGLGILLAVGSGWFGVDPKRRNVYGKWVPPGEKAYFHPTSPQLKPGCIVVFDRWVPWYDECLGIDGKKHWVKMCSSADIKGVWE